MLEMFSYEKMNSNPSYVAIENKHQMVVPRNPRKLPSLLAIKTQWWFALYYDFWKKKHNAGPYKDKVVDCKWHWLRGRALSLAAVPPLFQNQYNKLNSHKNRWHSALHMHLEMFTNDNYVCCLPFIYVWLLSFFCQNFKSPILVLGTHSWVFLIRTRGLFEAGVLQLMRIVCDPVISCLHAGAT